jgi:hypothetical protein
MKIIWTKTAEEAVARGGHVYIYTTPVPFNQANPGMASDFHRLLDLFSEERHGQTARLIGSPTHLGVTIGTPNGFPQARLVEFEVEGDRASVEVSAERVTKRFGKDVFVQGFRLNRPVCSQSMGALTETLRNELS